MFRKEESFTAFKEKRCYIFLKINRTFQLGDLFCHFFSVLRLSFAFSVVSQPNYINIIWFDTKCFAFFQAQNVLILAH